MNSQEYRNLQEAYKQVYSSQILNEFGPGDAGGSLAVKRTFGGAPGTKQNTTVSGSASLGGSNVSGSLEKGTFSGQGDKTSQGVDNTLSNYNNRNVPNYKPLDTSTSTSTTGVRGTLDANVSGKIGSGVTPQAAARKRDMQKQAMLNAAAKNMEAINQKKADDAAASRKLTPDDGKPGTSTQLKPNDETDRAKPPVSKYLQNRADLVRAGVTDEAGNENLNARTDLEKRLGGKDGATAGDLLTKLRYVGDENRRSQEARSTGVRQIVQKSPGVYGAESFELYDIILSHLINEGYADNKKSAKIIMENMSRVWLKSIIT